MNCSALMSGVRAGLVTHGWCTPKAPDGKEEGSTLQETQMSMCNPMQNVGSTVGQDGSMLADACSHPKL